ncbi:MAG TPA: YidC/Oxa1 family membrane protein insertase [Solirubrobacteraceae bacterium]|nr:YidC/Oxa1 family membrane protein insertase [Solirubrobacteraceae bacterium]
MPILANVIEDAFSPLISAFESVMVFIHDNIVGGSWGLAIVGLTVLIRGVLVPLTFRQLKGMQEMQRLSPQIQALKEKYKEDKQRQQQEIMNFYRENKINPLASCLPLLLQLPVFVSLFYMLRTDLKIDICGDQLKQHYESVLGRHFAKASEIPSGAVTHAGKHIKGLSEIGCDVVAPHSAKFLFLPDITEKATGAALIVLILLYVGSQVFSTLVATASADPNQRRLMLLLPVVFVVILYRYPAGLLVYWITTNLWTIAQQYLIKRHLGPPPEPAGAGGSTNGKSTRPLKPALAGVSSGGGGDGGSGASGGGGLLGRLAGGGASSAATEPEGKAKPSAPPPRPPRSKKKKRSGRRR